MNLFRDSKELFFSVDIISQRRKDVKFLYQSTD